MQTHTHTHTYMFLTNYNTSFLEHCFNFMHKIVPFMHRRSKTLGGA